MLKILALTALVCAISPVSRAHAESQAQSAFVIDDKTPRDFVKIFENQLTDAEGKPVSSQSLGAAKHVLVYFSAHWCPPCRAFTPKLVEFVKKNGAKAKLEVVFVSFDRSPKAMRDYMRETGMPWGAVQGKTAEIKDIGNGSSGIPTLRVFDSRGRIVADSYDAAGEYLGPDAALDYIKKSL